jgi:hypothetical protein
MYRKLVLCFCVMLLSAAVAAAQDMNSDRAAAREVNTDKAAAREVSKDKDRDMATAQDVSQTQAQDKDKELSGMSIVGNDEAPKSLYIVPWKSSEIGAETSFDMMLTDDDVPVDRDVFRRRLEFYRVSTGKVTSLSH